MSGFTNVMCMLDKLLCVSEWEKEGEMGDKPWVCEWCGACAVLQQREGGGGGREDVNVWVSVNGIDFMSGLYRGEGGKDEREVRVWVI